MPLDFVNSGDDDPVKAVRALTGGAGVDHAFEAVGNATLVRQAIESLAIRGTATIVGVLPPDAMIEFPWMAIRPGMQGADLAHGLEPLPL